MKADAPKKSGSLIILRGDNLNYQVLMLKRHSGMTFGNMYSFPGGKLEESDYLDSLKHSDESK
jgi:8-oxo-dGTP pyrophosphatase MutT (NUDIX family)